MNVAKSGMFQWLKTQEESRGSWKLGQTKKNLKNKKGRPGQKKILNTTRHFKGIVV